MLLEDKRPIGRFLLALAEKNGDGGVSQEGPLGICALSDLCILDVTDLLIFVFDLE